MVFAFWPTPSLIGARARTEATKRKEEKNKVAKKMSPTMERYAMRKNALPSNFTAIAKYQLFCSGIACTPCRPSAPSIACTSSASASSAAMLRKTRKRVAIHRLPVVKFKPVQVGFPIDLDILPALDWQRVFFIAALQLDIDHCDRKNVAVAATHRQRERERLFSEHIIQFIRIDSSNRFQLSPRQRLL